VGSPGWDDPREARAAVRRLAVFCLREARGLPPAGGAASAPLSPFYPSVPALLSRVRRAVGGAAGDSLADALAHTLHALGESPDALVGMFRAMGGMLSPAGALPQAAADAATASSAGVVGLDPDSPLGLFVRRARAAFASLSFEGIGVLCDRMRETADALEMEGEDEEGASGNDNNLSSTGLRCRHDLERYAARVADQAARVPASAPPSALARKLAPLRPLAADLPAVARADARGAQARRDATAAADAARRFFDQQSPASSLGGAAAWAAGGGMDPSMAALLDDAMAAAVSAAHAQPGSDEAAAAAGAFPGAVAAAAQALAAAAAAAAGGGESGVGGGGGASAGGGRCQAALLELARAQVASGHAPAALAALGEAMRQAQAAGDARAALRALAAAAGAAALLHGVGPPPASSSHQPNININNHYGASAAAASRRWAGCDVRAAAQRGETAAALRRCLGRASRARDAGVAAWARLELARFALEHALEPPPAKGPSLSGAVGEGGGGGAKGAAAAGAASGVGVGASGGEDDPLYAAGRVADAAPMQMQRALHGCLALQHRCALEAGVPASGAAVVAASAAASLAAAAAVATGAAPAAAARVAAATATRGDGLYASSGVFPPCPVATGGVDPLAFGRWEGAGAASSAGGAAAARFSTTGGGGGGGSSAGGAAGAASAVVGRAAAVERRGAAAAVRATAGAAHLLAAAAWRDAYGSAPMAVAHALAFLGAYCGGGGGGLGGGGGGDGGGSCAATADDAAAAFATLAAVAGDRLGPGAGDEVARLGARSCAAWFGGKEAGEEEEDEEEHAAAPPPPLAAALAMLAHDRALARGDAAGATAAAHELASMADPSDARLDLPLKLEARWRMAQALLQRGGGDTAAAAAAASALDAADALFGDAAAAGRQRDAARALLLAARSLLAAGHPSGALPYALSAGLHCRALQLDALAAESAALSAQCWAAAVPGGGAHALRGLRSALPQALAHASGRARGELLRALAEMMVGEREAAAEEEACALLSGAALAFEEAECWPDAADAWRSLAFAADARGGEEWRRARNRAASRALAAEARCGEAGEGGGGGGDM
jgi:hypothetical protein